MEVKTAAWGIVSLVIVAFGGIVIYAIEREGIKSDLSKSQSELNTVKALIETRQKSVVDRKEAYAALQERINLLTSTTERIKAIESQNEQLRTTIDQRRAQWTNTRAAFAKDIDAIRQKTKDEILPSMILADGKALKSVRFKDLKDATAILEHADGIAKVPLTNMPPDWTARLALGWNPKLSAELSGKPDEAPPVISAAAPSKTAEMVLQEHRESVKRAGVSDAEQKIKALERKVIDLERAQQTQIRISSEYAEKYNLAQMKGNASNHGVKRDEAARAAAAIGNQIEAVRAQIDKLFGEIDKNLR